MRRSVFPTFLIAVLFASCMIDFTTRPNQTEGLPPKTETGANTIGCLLNGKVFLPRGAGLLYGLNNNCGTNLLSVGMNDTRSTEADYIYLSLYPLLDTAYLISNYDSSSSNRMQFTVVNYGHPDIPAYNCYPVNSYSGHLSISKRDTVNRILAGTFWFDAIDTTNNTVVQVRDGRFDLRY